MCLKNEKPSTAKPETEVYGYVVMRTITVPYDKSPDGKDNNNAVRLLRSRCGPVTYEPQYKFNKWYKARYFISTRKRYVGCNYKNPPGFHAYRYLDAARFNRVDNEVVVRAKFKGVLMNGSAFDNSPCFRAMYRKLISVMEQDNDY